ncbi:hypothetical protein EV11_0975 [Prochlorococcus sp. SS52]|nr:hypothetical protein EV04_1570 [Prochlorococcus marinus str. LG]KGG19923.1 hypothetical protein EV08_1237 [Prochlorococcus marinus str. SS2]KGG23857.1 hypothetical protein EV09_0459 [Prochlorococcus marinus str. SS35]KGG31883.1 hypothetical protein EV10_1982 [Prochlorococcus marinus str. SS51]KGG35952.1 hypothetical protein EV11_0975 [Prochlorococcus sp. SS52]
MKVFKSGHKLLNMNCARLYWELARMMRPLRTFYREVK